MTAKRETGERYATTAPEGIEWFGKFFKRVAESDFLTARNGKWDKCDLTWLLNEDNFMKVVEGKYANAGAAA